MKLWKLIVEIGGTFLGIYLDCFKEMYCRSMRCFSGSEISLVQKEKERKEKRIIRDLTAFG